MALAFRPQIDLGLVLSAQNPQIDLKLDAYEQSTRAFLNLVSNYTKTAVTAIAEDTKSYNTEKTRLQEKIQHVQAETNQCKAKEIELLEGTPNRSLIILTSNILQS
jgi:kinetochore protein Spc25, fungi type